MVIAFLRPEELVFGLTTVSTLGDPVWPTKDKNIGYIAKYLTALRIDLREVRVIGNEEGAIEVMCELNLKKSNTVEPVPIREQN
jgi:hypothetical protein